MQDLGYWSARYGSRAAPFRSSTHPFECVACCAALQVAGASREQLRQGVSAGGVVPLRAAHRPRRVRAAHPRRPLHLHLQGAALLPALFCAACRVQRARRLPLLLPASSPTRAHSSCALSLPWFTHRTTTRSASACRSGTRTTLCSTTLKPMTSRKGGASPAVRHSFRRGCSLRCCLSDLELLLVA